MFATFRGVTKWLVACTFIAGLSACGGSGGANEGADLTSSVSAQMKAPGYGQPQSPAQQAAMSAKLSTYFGAQRAASPDGLTGEVDEVARKAATAGGLSPKAAYRFFNTQTGVHFYTISEEERAWVQGNYKQFKFEGSAFYAIPSAVETLQPVYRFYNTVSGTHFYTISTSERDHVIATWPEIFNYEGISWYASQTGGPGWRPIYRFFNTQTGTHFYSANPSEKESVQANLPQFSYEGIGYYIRLTDSMDSTLIGADANQNGVRDSVETVLGKLISDPVKRAANLPVVAEYEKLLSQSLPTTREQALLVMSGLNCKELNAGDRLFDSNTFGMLDVVFDTDIRAAQWRKFVQQLEGGYAGSELGACVIGANRRSAVKNRKAEEMPGVGRSPIMNKPVQVIFINGISNSSEDASDSAEDLALALEFSQYENFSYDFFHNPSEGTIRDNVELRTQAELSYQAATRISSSWTLPVVNANEAIKMQYYSILGETYLGTNINYDDGLDARERIAITTRNLANYIKQQIETYPTQRLVLVPHSQGNYYVESALGTLVKRIEMGTWSFLTVEQLRGKVFVFGVAPVSSTTWNIGGQDYISHVNDGAVNLHRTQLPMLREPLTSNARGCYPSKCSGNNANVDWGGLFNVDSLRHGFRETYLASYIYHEETENTFREYVTREVLRLMAVSREPSISNLSPTGGVLDQATTFTVSGSSLLSGATLEIEDADCQFPFNRTLSGFQQTCTPRGTPGVKAVTIRSIDMLGTVIDNSRHIVVFAAGAVQGGKLPHTGITADQCYGASTNALVACDSADALALSDQQDGHRSAVNPMSFSEVPRPEGGTYSRTECVRDNVSGLMWEGKMLNGARSSSRVFTNIGDGRSGDTSEYIAMVNDLALCGYDDWRLPTVIELQGIVDYGVLAAEAAVNIEWFPWSRTNSGVYWTNTPFNSASASVYIVDFQVGAIDGTPRTNPNLAVRLVRGSIPASAAFTYETASYGADASGNVAVDMRTGLKWRRCMEGQVWNGATCTGEATRFLHEQALSAAQAQHAWRIPNVKELASVAIATNAQAPGHSTIFPGVGPEPFWTATPWVPDPGSNNVWYVNFSDGSVYGWPRDRADALFRVRLVQVPSVGIN